MLDLTQSYQYWGPMIVLDTANGNIRRPSIALTVQLFVNSTPFTPVVAHATKERFMSTSPYGGGDLLLSDQRQV